MSSRTLLIARLKRWLTPLGWTLAVLALGLVGYRLITGGGAELLLERPEAWWTVVPAMVVYGLASALLAAAWWALLKPFDGGNIVLSSAYRIYAISQIGKYLPGNVMHFVGRAAMARTKGVPLTRSGFTMAQESVLMMTAALGLVAALGGTRWLGIPAALAVPAVILMALAALLVSSAPDLAARFGLAPEKNGLNAAPGLRRPAWAGVAILAYALFFCLSAGVLQAILWSLDTTAPFGLILAALCAGWLAGFVTPGASAGIGVREAVLMAALEPTVGPAAAAAALLFRLVTTGGDLLLFATGAALRRRMRTADRRSPPSGDEAVESDARIGVQGHVRTTRQAGRH